MAVVQYQLPDTGEVVPLLQIVPSKSGEERTAYWSRACQCARDDHHAAKAAPRGLPAVSRYDPYERVEEVHAERSRSQGAQSFYHDRQAARGIGGCSQHAQSAGIGDRGERTRRNSGGDLLVAGKGRRCCCGSAAAVERNYRLPLNLRRRGRVGTL